MAEKEPKQKGTVRSFLLAAPLRTNTQFGSAFDRSTDVMHYMIFFWVLWRFLFTRVGPDRPCALVLLAADASTQPSKLWSSNLTIGFPNSPGQAKSWAGKGCEFRPCFVVGPLLALLFFSKSGPSAANVYPRLSRAITPGNYTGE
jgi:hypothetical protein